MRADAGGGESGGGAPGQGAPGRGAPGQGEPSRGAHRPPSSSARTRDPRVLAGAVLGLLLLAVLGSALAGPWVLETGPSDAVLPFGPPPVTQTETLTPEAATDDLGDQLGDPPSLDLRPLLWVGVAGAFALTAWLVHTLLGRRGSDAGDPVAPYDEPADAPEPSLVELSHGLAEAAEVLRREGEPADAVVAAWVALERAAARSGVTRDPASTPTEFALLVLDRTSADRHATRSLLAGYERARFSDLPVSSDDVERAATDLRVLAATLRAGGAA